MSLLRDARIKKLRKELNITHDIKKPSPDDDYYTDNVNYNYFYIDFFDYIIIEKLFKEEFLDARFPEYRIAKLFFIMPVSKAREGTKASISSDNLIFYVKNFRQYKRMSDEDIAMMLSPENYFEHDGKFLYKHYYFCFIDYCASIFLIEGSLGYVLK